VTRIPAGESLARPVSFAAAKKKYTPPWLYTSFGAWTVRLVTLALLLTVWQFSHLG
jgi:hypothetical protein